MAPELVLEQVRFQLLRGQELTAHGEAARVAYRRDTGDVSAEGLHTVLPPLPNRAGMDLSSDRGSGNVTRRAFEARGHVKLATADGEEARTESAVFTPEGGKDGIIRGSEPVVVQGKGFHLEGPGFVLDPHTGNIDIQGGVRAVGGSTE